MPYAVENALFQWEEGDRRMRSYDDPERSQLDQAAAAVLDELRRRLGGNFELSELVDEYGRAERWVLELLEENGGPAWTRSTSLVADAAFHEYSRGARDYQP